MVPADNDRPAGIGVGITLRRMADNFFDGGSLVSALFHAIKCFFHRNRSTIHLQSGVAMILMQVSSSFPFFEARLGCCAGLAGPLSSALRSRSSGRPHRRRPHRCGVPARSRAAETAHFGSASAGASAQRMGVDRGVSVLGAGRLIRRLKDQIQNLLLSSTDNLIGVPLFDEE